MRYASLISEKHIFHKLLVTADQDNSGLVVIGADDDARCLEECKVMDRLLPYQYECMIIVGKGLHDGSYYCGRCTRTRSSRDTRTNGRYKNTNTKCRCHQVPGRCT